MLLGEEKVREFASLGKHHLQTWLMGLDVMPAQSGGKPPLTTDQQGDVVRGGKDLRAGRHGKTTISCEGLMGLELGGWLELVKNPPP